MSGTPEDDDQADDGLDEINQSEAVHSLGPAKEFAAWHHPRKQFVRIQQWCAEVRKLIPQLGLGHGEPFRYLTLPGNELLDVRAIHGVCSALNVKLRYLGFNSVGANTPDQIELALSQSEVRGLSSIDEFSAVSRTAWKPCQTTAARVPCEPAKTVPFMPSILTYANLSLSGR